jgi:hypothetical protein
VSQYGLSFDEAKSVLGTPIELLSHFPRDGSCVRFLCLTKNGQKKQLCCWKKFSENNLKQERPRKLSRQVLALARESLQIVSIPTLNIRSIQIHKPESGNAVHNSPYHAMFLLFWTVSRLVQEQKNSCGTEVQTQVDASIQVLGVELILGIM